MLNLYLHDIMHDLVQNSILYDTLKNLWLLIAWATTWIPTSKTAHDDDCDGNDNGQLTFNLMEEYGQLCFTSLLRTE